MSMHILRQSFTSRRSGATILVINVAVRQIVAGELTVGTLLQFIQYMLYLQYPLLALSWMISLLQRGKVSWTRIQELFSQDPEINDSEVEEENTETENLQLNELKFENVGLEINGQKLLENIDLKIERGKILGITGPTGSGKTLLVSLIARLIDPTTGEISINSEPLKKIPLKKLRSKIGFAAQEPTLFSRKIKENIAFGIDEKIWKKSNGQPKLRT